MKKLLTAAFLLAGSCTGFAQTATDFTCNDCSGVSHNLFSELDAGKVIVLDWVMPCGGCTGPSQTAYNLVTGYQSSHPGRVFFYMADDYANTNCTTLNGWANSIMVPQNAYSIRFSNAAIDMLDYGSTGMPKVVVLGGTNHTVFYNANNSVNAAALQNAIDAALISTGIDEAGSTLSGLTAYPNPADQKTEIVFNLVKKTAVTVELFNLQGKRMKEVFSGNLQPGENKIAIPVSQLPAATYLVKVEGGGISRYMNIAVAH